MARDGNRRLVTGTTGGVVLLHLAAFGAGYGLALPGPERLGGGWAVFLVAYLLGMRHAVDPGNLAAVGDGRRKLSGLGRRSGSAGLWFTLGYATTVLGFAFLITTAVRMLAWTDPRLAVTGAYSVLFLVILAAVQLAVLIGAVRMSRSGDDPGPEARFERLIRWARRSWQLHPIGAVSAVGLGVAAEVGLLVLAAGPVTLAVPGYPVVLLPLLFAAGMSLMTVLQGAAEAGPIRRIVLTAVTIVGVLAVAAMRLSGAFDVRLPGGLGSIDDQRFDLVGLLDDAQEQPAAVAGALLASPGPLVLLLVILAAVVAFQRFRSARSGAGASDGRRGSGRPEASGSPTPGPATGRARPERTSPAAARPETSPRRTFAAGSERVVARAAVDMPACNGSGYDEAAYHRPVYNEPVYHQPAHRQPVHGERPAPGIAVVTGAGAGVGRAIALGLAGAGYGILAVDVDGDSATACADEARRSGVPAQAVRADVRDPRYLERIRAVAEEWGRTEVLVNAGAGGWPHPVPGRTADISLSGLFSEPMRLRGGGAIVNVVPATSAHAQDLIRFTADRAGARDGVRTMCLTFDELASAGVVTAVLGLVRRGNAGAVVEPGGARFARGTASVA